MNNEQIILNDQRDMSSTTCDTSNNAPEETYLFDILLVLAKSWKYITVVPVVVAIIVLVITLFIPNTYTAKTIIIPSDSDNSGMGNLMSQLGGLIAIAGGSVGSKTSGDQYISMLKSISIKDPLVTRFKLMDRYNVKYRVDAYNKLDEIAAISLGKKDGLITISISDEDPKLAAEMANEYVNQLGKLITRLSMNDAGENRNFLQKRLAETKADLTKAEEALRLFQDRNKAISVTDQAKATIEGVAQLRAQLAIQEIQLGTLKRQFTENSQEVKNSKSTINQLRSQITDLEGKNKTSSSIPSVGSVPQLGQEYIRLMREFKIQETVLEMLTKQYEVAKLSEAKDTTSFQVLEPAKTPERKSKPQRGLIVIMSAFATCFLMILIAFIQELNSRMSLESQNKWKEIKKQLSDIPKPLSRILK